MPASASTRGCWLSHTNRVYMSSIALNRVQGTFSPKCQEQALPPTMRLGSVRGAEGCEVQTKEKHGTLRGEGGSIRATPSRGQRTVSRYMQHCDILVALCLKRVWNSSHLMPDTLYISDAYKAHTKGIQPEYRLFDSTNGVNAAPCGSCIPAWNQVQTSGGVSSSAPPSGSNAARSASAACASIPRSAWRRISTAPAPPPKG